MTEKPGPKFSHEERLEQAAGNWWALHGAIIDYLRELGHSPQAFSERLGERFAPGWEAGCENLQQIAYYAALHPVSLGAELRGYDVGDDEATVRLRLPTFATEMSSSEHVKLLSDTYRAIMDHLDIDYKWERDSDVFTFRLRRRAED